MHKLGSVALALAFAGVASAQLKISIGVRETAAGGGSDVGIGGNAGSSGGIEWLNMDAQTLVLDGTWQKFSFTMATATVTGFAGTTANGVLDGAYGSLECIRVVNATGITQELKLWIDDLENTITPVGAGPITNTFGTWEGYATDTEAIFQEPGFSGSTSANIDLNTDYAGVDNTTSHSGSASYATRFTFVDNSPTRWLRMTTFNATNQPNPLIRFDQQSEVSFWVKAVPESTSMIVLGLGAAALASRRRRK